MSGVGKEIKTPSRASGVMQGVVWKAEGVRRMNYFTPWGVNSAVGGGQIILHDYGAKGRNTGIYSRGCVLCPVV